MCVIQLLPMVNANIGRHIFITYCARVVRYRIRYKLPQLISTNKYHNGIEIYRTRASSYRFIACEKQKLRECFSNVQLLTLIMSTKTLHVHIQFDFDIQQWICKGNFFEVVCKQNQTLNFLKTYSIWTLTFDDENVNKTNKRCFDYNTQREFNLVFDVWELKMWAKIENTCP